MPRTAFAGFRARGHENGQGDGTQRRGQGYYSPPFVEVRGDQRPHRWIIEPVHSEEGPLDSTNLAERCGECVLLPIGGELFRDQRRRGRSVAHGENHATDVVPVDAEEVCIELLPEKRRRPPYLARGSKAWSLR